MSRSMIFALDPRIWLGAIALLMLAGCGPAKVVVEGNFPEPLMEPIPIKLGVWYPEEFANHEFFDEAKSRNESDWIVQTGTAQVQMWDTLLSGMFYEMVRMKGKPGPGQMNQVVNAVLVPHVEELQYAIPTHTNVKVYEIWMRYRFELVRLNGETIAEWSMPAYGKTPTAFLQSDEAAVNLAAVMALRDAGANFAVTFQRVPEVAAWLARVNNSTAVPVGAHSVGDSAAIPVGAHSVGDSRPETAPTTGASRSETAPTTGPSRPETAPMRSDGKSRSETAPTDTEGVSNE